MANYIPNPFLEGMENDNTEVVVLYNKNFKGVDMKYFQRLIKYYKKNKPEKLKNLLIELVGMDMFNLIVKEYIEDINERGTINQFSTLPDGKAISELRKAIELITNNKERIKESII